MKYLKIQTNVHEVYMKLPSLNFTNEVIFSNQVSDRAINRIVDKFLKNGVVIEAIKIGDRTVLIKKGDIKFNVYLLNV
jgi:hypothetical protein